MTFVEAAFFFPYVVCAISLLWLLAYVVRNIKQDRKDVADRGKVVRGLDGLEELQWNNWSFPSGWPPCWHGCTGLHRDDWWKAYVYQTCWDGCADLHRDDWWKAYLDRADDSQRPLPADNHRRSPAESQRRLPVDNQRRLAAGSSTQGA